MTRVLRLTCAAMAVLTLAVPPMGRVEAGPVFRYGFTSGVVGDTNPTDARAATLVWLRQAAQALGLPWSFEANVLDGPGAVVDGLSSGRVDMAAMTSLEYLAAERELTSIATPELVFEFSNDVMLEFELICRQDVRAVGDLQGKRLAILDRTVSADLGRLWLDGALRAEGLPDQTKWFGAIRPMQKRGQGAMAVFFGQADAALETKTAFDTAVELNPQLGRQLKVLARSPGLLSSVIVCRNGMDRGIRDEALRQAGHLHELPQYRQHFMVLRVTRLVPWNPPMLESVRALITKARPGLIKPTK
jgi:ABC-type phosphate/phosphonate transport system substrate-binding protein